MTTAGFVYILCASTAFLCAVLLFRSFKETRMKLLFWSSLCFIGLTLNNVFMFFDMIVFPVIDFGPLRTIPALVGTALMVYGLIVETTG